VSNNHPLVGVLMGSDSDLEVMREACRTLERFEVAFEVRIISAHRWPDECHRYARTARERGLRVIIAGAGGAAHLAGCLAASTTIPVIGVPIANGPLHGVDALHSTVQMPPGVPVATVGVNAARNAALLAVQILAVADEGLREALSDYKQALAENVQERDQRLRTVGWKDYSRPS